jgi:hypothetical protein
MNKIRCLQSLSLLLLVAFLTGCEIGGDGGSDSDANPLVTTATEAASENPAPAAAAAATPAPAAAPTSGLDELDISGAAALGPHSGKPAQAARITRLLYKADKQGDSVSLSYDKLGWPTRRDGKTIDGGVYLYWVEGGRVIGGLFDWHAVGQNSKTLENVYGGYLGRRPARGATVWFTIVSIDGAQRTNVKRSGSTW